MLPRYIREMRRCNINASHEIFVAILPFISLARSVHYTEERGRLQRGGERAKAEGTRDDCEVSVRDERDEKEREEGVTGWRGVGYRSTARVEDDTERTGREKEDNLHFTLHLKRLSRNLLTCRRRHTTALYDRISSGAAFSGLRAARTESRSLSLASGSRRDRNSLSTTESTRLFFYRSDLLAEGH